MRDVVQAVGCVPDLAGPPPDSTATYLRQVPAMARRCRLAAPRPRPVARIRAEVRECTSVASGQREQAGPVANPSRLGRRALHIVS